MPNFNQQTLMCKFTAYMEFFSDDEQSSLAGKNNSGKHVCW